MPIFELQTPDGKSFEVDAPDIQSAVEALGMGQQQPPQQPQGGAWDRFKDDVAQTASGLGEGVMGLAGTIGDVQNLAGKGGRYFSEKTGIGDPQSMEMLLGSMGGVKTPGTPEITQGAQDMGVPLAGEAQYPEGKYFRTGGQIAPGAVLGPGSIASKAFTTGLAAAGSESAGQWAHENMPGYEQLIRGGGALAGGLAPSMVKRAVSPLPISADRLKQVNVLRNEGVEPTAGQMSGRTGLKYAESEMGGHRAADMMERQGEQFTGAALRRTGENANRARPEVIDSAFNRVGKQFQALSARNSVTMDNQLANDLVAVQKEYESLVGPHAQASIIKDTINDIPMGVMQGDAYQSLASKLARDARNTRVPELKRALYGIRAAVDDAMERGLAANKSPDLGAWREARTQYRHLFTIAKAASGAGEATAGGLISPAKLRSAITSQGQDSRVGYSRGRGDLSELTHAGEEILTPLPNSGTAGRTRVSNALQGVSSVMGAILGGQAGDLTGAVIGGAVGTAAPYTIARALLSKPGQAYLKSQLGSKIPSNPKLAAIIAALMAKQPKSLEGSIGGGDISQAKGGWAQ